MSSTESSNWNLSPGSRPRNNLYEAERARQTSPIPIPETSNASAMELMNDYLGITGSSTEETPRQPNSSHPSEAPQRTNATTETPYWNNPYHSNATESQQTPANPGSGSQFGVLELRDANPAQPASQAQKNPFWEAARSAVLNTVTTSQDLNPDTSSLTPTQPNGATPTQQPDDHTPTQTSMATPRGRGSSRSRGSTRGGRRGISSSIRRPTIKIEPASEDSVPTLDNPAIATDTPTPLTAAPAAPTTTISRGDRPKNRGGRPRGSRAGNSAARAGRTVNRGGRPRGSRAGVSSASRVGVKRKRRRNLTDDEDDEGSDVSEKMALPMLSSSGRKITQTGQFGGMLGNGVGGGVIDLDAEEEGEEEDGEDDRARVNGLVAGIWGHHASLAVRDGPGSRGGRGRGSYHHAALAAAAAQGNHAATPTTTDSGSGGAGGGRGHKRKRLSLLGNHATSTKDSALAAVCKNCGRGHSPSSNQIVFCDTCNTPWHQYCHDRPITPSVIIHEDKEWHCADCELLSSIEQINRGRISGAEMARMGGGGVTQERTLKWKRDYLMSQGKEVLVGLLLGAELRSISTRNPMDTTSPMAEDETAEEDRAPAAATPGRAGGLRLFDPSSTFATPAAVANAAIAATTTISNAIPHLENQAAAAQSLTLPVLPENDDDVYEEPLPYPRTGNGLILPPEAEDFDVLVDEGVGGATFSHSWQDGGEWRGVLAEQGGFAAAAGMHGGGLSFVGGQGGMGAAAGRMEVSVGA